MDAARAALENLSNVLEKQNTLVDKFIRGVHGNRQLKLDFGPSALTELPSLAFDFNSFFYVYYSGLPLLDKYLHSLKRMCELHLWKIQRHRRKYYPSKFVIEGRTDTPGCFVGEENHRCLVEEVLLPCLNDLGVSDMFPEPLSFENAARFGVGKV
ncbi:hypothetical protein BDF20DRAFT_1001517 [Mycotypha africana]|uniref:uncharacterized protein n=1 Tax=Mycotypha africana TaxID=64632 RepID=UPI0023003349|nr:uncharacterized protein BDF20DRAFT_1001517 [Mycotypha africana]KAI8977566.1 hypothetical protein BDF20DRAFT_1001517 [Mycotypha africana]